MAVLVKRWLCVLAGFFVLLYPFARVQAEPIRQELETVYSELIDACREGNLDLVEKKSSSHWLARIRNNYASAKRTFGAEQARGIAESYPDLRSKDFVKVLQQGSTAGLVYVSDSDARDATDKPRISFTFVKFVNEGGSWRLHGLALLEDQKYKAPGLLTKFSEKKLPADMAIDGRVPETPALAGRPEMAGQLDVYSYGYATDVYINGVRQVAQAEGVYVGWIRGGLRSGRNALRVTIRPAEGLHVRPPKVTIRVARGTQGLAEAFRFTPSGGIVGTHDLTFKIDVE